MTSSSTSSSLFEDDTRVSLAIYFEVHPGQMAAFKALVAGPNFIDRVRSESGCLNYSFAFTDNIAYSREGYLDADAVLAHMQNTHDLAGQALAISKIVRLEVHAPAAEIEKLRGPLEAVNPTFFTLEPGGIRRVGEA